jgi:4'-phosphopantetheinyl transferase EntD
MGGLLVDLVPESVSVIETFGDRLDGDLYPGEEACIAGSVAKRRHEFTTVRICARTALARLGVPPGPILPGLRGAPGWPAGVVGSMTHCDGYRAAAVAHRHDVLSIGVDAEPDRALPAGVLEVIALPDEAVMVSRLSRSALGLPWDRLLFSAKEAVYKAWFPLTATWLDFSEARIEFEPQERTFHASLLVPGPMVAGRRLPGFYGRWLCRDGFVLTAIVLRASAGPD